jgi:anthranilate synthase component 1
MYSPDLRGIPSPGRPGQPHPRHPRLLADCETPLSAYRKIRGQGESFLFESVEGGEHLGRYSFVGCNPRAVLRQNGARLEILENGRVVDQYTVTGPGPAHAAAADAAGSDRLVRDGLVVVERMLQKFRPVSLPGLPRFTGGAVGFIGYEFIHDVEPGGAAAGSR